MTEDFVRLPTDGIGKKIRSIKTTVGANEVYQEVFNIADATDNIINPTKEDGNLLTLTRAQNIYKQNLDYDDASNLIYAGLTEPGSITSQASWQIKKLTWSGSNLTSVEWADGNRDFDNIWDNRTGLDYN